MDELNEFIPTRSSLLSRLKDWKDDESWRVFFETYQKLIYKSALKAGLSEAESLDVVQETLLSVVKTLPGFRYDTKKGSFKGWLMRLTRWRIADHYRNRARAREGNPGGLCDIEEVPDPAGLELDALWDKEWETTLARVAVARVKRTVDPKQYQVFDCYVQKQWPVSRVARLLRINPGHVYLIKHRILRMIRLEVNRLRTRPI